MELCNDITVSVRGAGGGEGREGGDSTAGSVFSVVSRRLDRRRLARRGCRHPAVTLYHLQPGRCPAHHHTSTTTSTSMCQCGAQPGPGAVLLVVVAGESCPMFPGEECSPAPGSSTCTPRGHHTPLQAASVLLLSTQNMVITTLTHNNATWTHRHRTLAPAGNCCLNSFPPFR